MARRLMRRPLRVLVLALAALWLAAAAALAGPGAEPARKAGPAVYVPGMVTLVDVGADYCPPCRLMEPVVKRAESEYGGRAAVVRIDVTRYPALAASLGVRVIPTLIFYDRNGREAARHVGYLDRKSLNGQLDKLLAQ